MAEGLIWHIFFMNRSPGQNQYRSAKTKTSDLCPPMPPITEMQLTPSAPDDYSQVCTREHAVDTTDRYWHAQGAGPFQYLEEVCPKVNAYRQAIALANSNTTPTHTTHIDLSELEQTCIFVVFTDKNTGQLVIRRRIWWTTT